MTIPRTVGKYDIMDIVGTGGMGTVYRAFDRMLERVVALKIVQFEHDGVAPAELSARFRNEARAVAHLNHPAIVTIFDYDDQDPAGPYIAMEYVDGCALNEYVELRPELHLEDAISAMQQVLGGLAYAHRQGVIHRDIKPPNILVTREGLVKITDFGIARIGPRSQTQSGYIMGTPQYMAPEQYMGGVVDHRCDIHAAGAVLYTLLTGSPPYRGTAAEVMYKVCHEAPKPLAAVAPSIPPSFETIVAKALDKNPANRYSSAGEFQDALRTCWQTVSSKPASQTLSASARMIATVISRQPSSQSAVSGSPAGQLPGQAAASDSAELIRVSRQPSAHRPDTGSLSAWSREQLAEVERQLMAIMGPMARILVREAAATTASKQELYRLLASHLNTPEERQRFLLSGGPIAAGGPGGPAPSVANSQASIVRRPLTPEAAQRAGQLLARYLGPIAIVVTRRAAQTATDEAELYSMLAERVTDSAERERFIIEAARQR
jgi:serine/threonine protein kinase